MSTAAIGGFLFLLATAGAWVAVVQQQRYRLRFEMLLTDLFADFVEAHPSEIDAKIRKWLAVIARVFQVDRTAFSKLEEDGSGSRVIHDFAAENIPRLDSHFSAAKAPWMFSMLNAGQVVNVRRAPFDLPPDALLDREHFIRLRLKSLLIVPMQTREAGTYIVSFGCVRRYGRWGANPHVRLRLICEIFARALAMASAIQTEERLARVVEQEQKRMNEILTDFRGVVWELRGRPSDPTSRMEYVSDNVHGLLGYTAREWISEPQFWRTVLHPEDLDEAVRMADQVFMQGGFGTQQFRWQTRAGVVLWIEAHVAVTTDAEGRPAGLRGVAYDISERKRVEHGYEESQRLLQKSHEQVRQLAGRLISAQEEERRRIAQELHDDLSQRLAAQAIALSNLQRELETGDRASVEHGLEKLRSNAVAIADDVRAISHELHPPVLMFAGLTASLESLCREFTAINGLRVSFRVEVDPGPVSSDAALCLYRAAQEALRNVCKHAQATSATVTLTRRLERIVMRIEDDGVGVAPDSGTHRRGLGLISLRERAHLLQGSFSVTPRTSGGTCLEVGVPGD